MTTTPTPTRDLPIDQYQASDNLLNYVASLFTTFDTITSDMATIRFMRSIDNATGDALDIIGEIVGADREVQGAGNLGFWGFYENAFAQGSADEATPTVGGVFKSDTDRSTSALLLTDAQYRYWIRARIIINNRPCTIDNVIEYAQNLMLGLTFAIEVTETMLAANIRVHGVLPPLQRAVMATLLNQFHTVTLKLSLSDNLGNIALIGHN